jgi:hypothetical protein
MLLTCVQPIDDERVDGARRASIDFVKCLVGVVGVVLVCLRMLMSSFC